MKRLLFCFLLLIIFNLLYSQRFGFGNEDTLRFYLRKSISFYNNFLLAKGVSIPSDKYEYILDKFREKVIGHKRLIRFDHNPIPKELMEKVRKEFSSLSSPTIEQVKQIIDKNFAPMIIKILEIEKEIRAKEFVNRLERKNFLTTKAKEIGITADDLEKIMNAAYVIIAYIDRYEEKESKIYEKSKDYYLSGGMLVYRLQTVSSEFILYGWKRNDGATPLIRIGDPFRSAVIDFLEDFEVLIRDLFKLSAEIISTYGDKAVFNLGEYFGISIDDKFDFVELYEEENGMIKQKRVGHGIIKKVGINESELQIITGRPEKGMLAIERPRSSIEFRLGIVSFPLKIRSYDGMELFILEKENKLCLGVNSWLGIDNRLLISDLIGIPQTFLTLNLFGTGFPLGAKLKGEETIQGKLFKGENLWFYYYEFGKIGLMKRWYFRRLAFGIQTALKCWSCNIVIPDTSIKDNPSTRLNLGGEISSIMEFVITPDINWGLRISYGLGKDKIWEFPPPIGEQPSGRVGPEASLETIGWEIYLAINPKIW